MLVFPFSLFPQVMGNRRSDEPPKTKKGLSSILDPARWNRGEPPGKRASLSLACPVDPGHSSSLFHSFVSAPDFRHLKVEVDGNGLIARVSILDLREEVWAWTPVSREEGEVWTPVPEGGGLGLDPSV